MENGYSLFNFNLFLNGITAAIIIEAADKNKIGFFEAGDILVDDEGVDNSPLRVDKLIMPATLAFNV